MVAPPDGDRSPAAGTGLLHHVDCSQSFLDVARSGPTPCVIASGSTREAYCVHRCPVARYPSPARPDSSRSDNRVPVPVVHRIVVANAAGAPGRLTVPKERTWKPGHQSSTSHSRRTSTLDGLGLARTDCGPGCERPGEHGEDGELFLAVSQALRRSAVPPGPVRGPWRRRPARPARASSAPTVRTPGSPVRAQKRSRAPTTGWWPAAVWHRDGRETAKPAVRRMRAREAALSLQLFNRVAPEGPTESRRLGGVVERELRQRPAEPHPERRLRSDDVDEHQRGRTASSVAPETVATMVSRRRVECSLLVEPSAGNRAARATVQPRTPSSATPAWLTPSTTKSTTASTHATPAALARTLLVIREGPVPGRRWSSCP